MDLAVIDEQAILAREAGFSALATQLEAKAKRARALAVAYEHFRYVSDEQIRDFNARLVASTKRRPTEKEVFKVYSSAGMMSLWSPDIHKYVSDVYDELRLDALEAYTGLPPVEVMLKVKEAKSRGIFDAFEVAHVQPVATRIVFPDPIVFGRVEGCTDRFFIAEWGNDVSLADLVGPNGG